MREVIGQSTDIDHVLVVGPKPEALPDQDAGVELIEDLLFVEQFLRHPAAERGLARIPGDAQVEAAQRFVLGRNQDEAVRGHQRRRQAGFRFLQTTSEIFELFIRQLALGGLVLVDVAQRQQPSGSIDDLGRTCLIRR